MLTWQPWIFEDGVLTDGCPGMVLMMRHTVSVKWGK